MKTINTNEDNYYEKEYVVSVYPGAGYALDEYKVFANSEEEALELLVVYFEENDGYSNLYTVDEVAEDADEDETMMYIDATMLGASQPYYLGGFENARIREIPMEVTEECTTETITESNDLYDENTPIRAWIGNLGKYNEGELIGGWVSFPIDEEDLEKFLKDAVKIDDEYEEYGIFDWESDYVDFPGEYADLEEVNEWAEKIDELSEYDKKVFENANEYFGDIDILDFDPDDYVLIEDVNDDSDFGYWIVDEIYGGIENLDTDTLTSWVDIDDWIDDIRRYDDWAAREDFQQENGYESEDDYDEEEFEEYFENYLDMIREEAEADPVGFMGKDQLENHFDYDEFGRQSQWDFTGGFTKDGFIYQN